MNWRERIVTDPAVLVGKAVIKGTRVSVELVMDQLARGYTMEQVLSQHPGITLQDLQASFGFVAELLHGRPTNLAGEPLDRAKADAAVEGLLALQKGQSIGPGLTIERLINDGREV